MFVSMPKSSFGKVLSHNVYPIACLFRSFGCGDPLGMERQTPKDFDLLFILIDFLF
jgi:hypothetical protein